MKTVLLGAGGTGTSFAIASRLRANWGSQLKIVITDIFDEHLVTASFLADTFIKVPYANDSQFGQSIIDIILSENIQTYIPILNDELILAASLMAQPLFSQVDFWSFRNHSLCADKAYADEWLNGIGVRTPKSIAWNDKAAGTGPWFAKPRNGFGSKGARVVYADDMRNMDASEASNLMVQEICEGPEVTVDSFYDSATGDCYSYCRERLEIKSGVCTKARIFQDRELADIAGKIGRALDQRGTICFQVMKSKSGWAVTDLNLRSGAGTAMTCAAGFDVLSAAYACRIGEDYKKYVTQLPESQQIFVTRQYSEFVMKQ
jgi:carbamoylphosphate synthase large subunit